MPWLISPYRVKGSSEESWDVGTYVEYVGEDVLSPLAYRYRFPDGSVHVVSANKVTEVLDNHLVLYIVGATNAPPDYPHGHQFVPYDREGVRRILREMGYRNVDSLLREHGIT